MSLMVGGHSWWSGGGTGGASGGKSAVQLLQESKSQYVKSDLVLCTSQRPARPDRFHISSNPNIFLNASSHTLHASRLSPDPPRKSPGSDESKVTTPTKTLTALTPSSLAEHTNATSGKCMGVTLVPVRIQRGAPRPRAKTQPIGDAFSRGGDLRRSLSHGPADRGGGEDIQMKLRRLLDVGSIEKLFPESPTATPKQSFLNGEVSTGTGTFRAEPAKVTVHKSLPELFKISSMSASNGDTDVDSSVTDKRRPSCPSAISTDRESSVVERIVIAKPVIKPKPPVKPPPVPPRKSREGLRPLPQLPKEPPEVPKRPAPLAPPPKLPPRSKPPVPLESSVLTAPPTAVDCCRRSSDSDASATGGSEDMRRRPILRSKSDVTHERCTLGQKDEDVPSPRESLNVEDLERFFESMGLDLSTYKEVISPTEVGSPLYFDEKSSEDSIPRRCSSDEDGQAQQTPLRPGEPSIIEKNARVIKWLFTCQRAQGCLAQRPSTKSS